MFIDGDDAFTGVYIYQNSSNCTFYCVQFIECQLYLNNDEKIH